MVILKLLKKLNKIVNINQIEIRDRLVIINDIELSFNEISYITDSLQTKVITKKKENAVYGKMKATASTQNKVVAITNDLVPLG